VSDSSTTLSFSHGEAGVVTGHVNDKAGKRNWNGVVVKTMHVTEGAVRLEVRVYARCEGRSSDVLSNSEFFIHAISCPLARQPSWLPGRGRAS
jgi:hypothetical protein